MNHVISIGGGIVTFTIGRKARIALVSECDAELIDMGWAVLAGGRKEKRLYYAMKVFKINKKYHHCLLLHREILARMLGRELLTTEEVDHINGNGLDNRRENLRLANRAQQNRNTRMKRNNTSGFKGVSYHKPNNRWCAYITVNSKTVYLGSFLTPEEAHEAYCKKATEVYGEFANFGNGQS